MKPGYYWALDALVDEPQPEIVRVVRWRRKMYVQQIGEGFPKPLSFFEDYRPVSPPTKK